MSKLRAVLIAAIFLLSGCSGLPKIIILHDPLSADEHVRLGIIYESEGKNELAAAQYRAGIKKDKSHFTSYLRLAELSYRNKDYREAEKAFEKAIKLRPENGDLYNNLAWVYIQQGSKLGRAEGLVKKAMELTPSNRPYYLDTLGMILLGQGRVDEAVEALKASARAIPDDRPAQKSEAFRHLADAYREAKDEQGARQADMEADRYYAIMNSRP